MAVCAALDIGSNSVKLLVADVADGGYQVLLDESRVTGLGRGLGEGGQLDPEAIAQTLDCLREFCRLAFKLGAESVRAAGTSALRRAADAKPFIARVREELGLSIEVISGMEEARLGRAVALRELPEVTGNVVLFDVGGGSTELTLCRNENPLAECSLKLGARRCTEEAGVVQPVSPSMAERLAAMIETALAYMPEELAPDAVGAEVRLAGLGGTATTLCWMLAGLRGEERGDPHLARIALDEAAQLHRLMANKTSGQLRAMPNLDPARADIMYAGIAIILGLLRRYGATDFTLVDRGLRFGLLLA